MLGETASVTPSSASCPDHRSISEEGNGGRRSEKLAKTTGSIARLTCALYFAPLNVKKTNIKFRIGSYRNFSELKLTPRSVLTQLDPFSRSPPSCCPYHWRDRNLPQSTKYSFSQRNTFQIRSKCHTDWRACKLQQKHRASVEVTSTKAQCISQ